MLTRFLALAALCFFGAGCEAVKTAMPEPPVQVVTVKIPVPQPCVRKDQIPERPAYGDSDGELAPLDFAKRIQTEFAARALRDPYEDQLRAIIDNCVAAAMPVQDLGTTTVTLTPEPTPTTK